MTKPLPSTLRKWSLIGWVAVLPISAFILGYGVCSITLQDKVRAVVETSQESVDEAQQRVGATRVHLDQLRSKLAQYEGK